MIPLDDAIKVVHTLGLTSGAQLRAVNDLERTADVEKCYSDISKRSMSNAKKIEIAVKHFLEEIEGALNG